MNNREHDIELIEVYLAGRLSDKEKKVVVLRLSTDGDFKILFDEMTNIISGIKKNKKLDLLQKLKTVENQISEEWTEEEKTIIDQIDNNIIIKTKSLTSTHKTQKELDILINGVVFRKKKKLFHSLKQLEETLPEISVEEKREATIFSIRNLLSIAAVITLLFVAGWWFLGESPSPTDKLFANNFEPYPMIGDTRALSDDNENLENQILKVYSKRDFEKAIPLISELYEIEKPPMFLLYQAISFLGNDQSDEAIRILNQFENESKILIDQSYWYKGLAYLKKGDTKSATTQLQKINKSNTKLFEKATNLLDQIKTLK